MHQEEIRELWIEIVRESVNREKYFRESDNSRKIFRESVFHTPPYPPPTGYTGSYKKRVYILILISTLRDGGRDNKSKKNVANRMKKADSPVFRTNRFAVLSWLFMFDPRIYYSLCHI